MPRPGPRPYECVRRAWHSERHQPIRGSVIQQIFRFWVWVWVWVFSLLLQYPLVHFSDSPPSLLIRVVLDTHAAQTKKNREWQEKLPIVVFKAEEIIYSKANSEAEYMNLDTLWDRVNDAINTIIRKDESAETGELLPPCVEAALNLGCIPVRASRSQRHSHPRTYLNHRPHESASMPTRIVDKTIDEQCPKLSPLNSGNQLNFARSTSKGNWTLQAFESNCRDSKNDNLSAHQSYTLFENVLPVHNKMMTMESNIPLKLGSVYPLYYGTHYQTQGSQIPENMNSTPIFVGKPVGTSNTESAEMGVLPNLLSCPTSEMMASKTVPQPDFRDTYKMPLVTECDLSLRLGLFSDPCMSIDRSSAGETEDVQSSSFQEINKFCNPSLINKEFCFFPGKTVNDPSQSCLRNWFSEGECYSVGGSTRMPNYPFGDKSEDVQCCRQPGLPSNQLISRIKGPGS